MHPILFRIPLPKTSIPIIWVVAIIAGLALLFAASEWFRKKDKANALIGVGIGLVAIVGRFIFRESIREGLKSFAEGREIPPDHLALGPIPIYSYGVMLGLSLVVGWYLTLTLAEKDGLPKETMANNYVVTAIAAIAGSRILYVLTNLNEFSSPLDIFALRRGGLVAYGGFLGGFLGSLFYLRKYRIPLLPWADVAVPSLASGLMITRIGCYLFGCDFGRPLCGPETAPSADRLVDCASPAAPPHWLQSLGTFPRWEAGLLHEGSRAEGAPAWTQHVKQQLINDTAATSLPVHPTQIYESLLGAALLALLLWARTRQKFRGQIFILFTFAYGVGRYMIEILRDDEERGSLPFSADRHVMIPLGLAILAVGFTFSFAHLIKNLTARRIAQALAFAPALIMYIVMMPSSSYIQGRPYQWSTSQFVAITTGFAVCVLFSVLYRAALQHPESAMAIPLPEPALVTPDGQVVAAPDANVADADEEEDEVEAPKKAAPKKAEADRVKAKVAREEGSEESAAVRPRKGKPVKRGALKKPAVKVQPVDEESDSDSADDKRVDDKRVDDKRDDDKKDTDES